MCTADYRAAEDAGVDELGDYAVTIRAKMMTVPGEQFVIRRKAYAMIKKAFDENGIKLASPTVQSLAKARQPAPPWRVWRAARGGLPWPLLLRCRRRSRSCELRSLDTGPGCPQLALKRLVSRAGEGSAYWG
jgi:hypothetical protein